VGFHTSPMTCVIDGQAHLVDEDEAVAGIAAGRGTYLALCGHLVHVAALVTSPGRPCPRCAFRLATRDTEAGGAAEPRPQHRKRRAKKRRRRGEAFGHHPAQVRDTAAPGGRDRPTDTKLRTAR
jgi:hypothetical protein